MDLKEAVERSALNVVHQHADGTWWFCNETYSDEYGPFETKDACEHACNEYAKHL